MVKAVITTLFYGSFNPEYKKMDQKRMRYIQKKYSLAYGSAGVDASEIVSRIDPLSKLR